MYQLALLALLVGKSACFSHSSWARGLPSAAQGPLPLAFYIEEREDLACSDSLGFSCTPISNPREGSEEQGDQERSRPALVPREWQWAPRQPRHWRCPEILMVWKADGRVCKRPGSDRHFSPKLSRLEAHSAQEWHFL